MKTTVFLTVLGPTPGLGIAIGVLGGIGSLLLLLTWVAPTKEKRPTTRVVRLRVLLAEAGLAAVPSWVFLGVCAAASLLGTGIGLTITGAPPVAVIFALVGAWLPVAAVRTRKRRRRRDLREIWPDVVDTILSGIRAGMSLPETLIALGENGPEAARPDFAFFAQEFRTSGRFEQALLALKERFSDPVADRIIEALRLAHRVGGNDLGQLLRNLSRILRADLRTRGELEARQAITVNGARLAVAAPWVVLVLIASRPEAGAAYSTPTGAAVIAGGAVACALAYPFMLRLGRLPEDERTLG